MDCDRRRRALLLGGAAGMLATRLPQAFAQADGGLKDAYVPRTKHALLIGNRVYANNKDIPPAHKNVADVRETLEFLEFKVSSHTDLDATAMRAAITSFGAMIRDIAENTQAGSLAVVFYFCGHGFQSDGQNYLVPAGIDPTSEGALKQSLKLMDEVLAMLPRRYPGLSVALIDACRTDPTFKKGADDLNQISAPEGTMVFFATRAGRPALAPIDPNRNTFFTEAVCDTLSKSNGVTPLDDLFQIAASNCQRKVKDLFDKAKINWLPQYPEVTGNLRGKFVIRNRDLEINRQRRRQQAISPLGGGSAEEDRWIEIRKTIKPREVVRLCEVFLKTFPDGEYTQTAQATLDGARLAADSQRAAGLSSDAIDTSIGNEDYRDDLVKAVRGDKDAAHRIAIMYRDGNGGMRVNLRRVEIWLKFSAELGNGIASWQLSEYYSSTGMVGEAARYERRAVDLGYRPPPRLSNRGY